MSKNLKRSRDIYQSFIVFFITFSVVCLQESHGDGMVPIIRSSEAKGNTILVPSLLACSLSFLLIISYRSKTGKLFTGITGPQRLPIIGSLYVLAGSHEQILPKLSTLLEKYGGRVLLWMGYTPLVLIMQVKDVEIVPPVLWNCEGRGEYMYGKGTVESWHTPLPHIRKVLSSPKFVQKAKLYDLWMKWVLGEGLVTSEAETWKVDRKLFNPSFKYQRFDGFLDSFNKHGNILVSILSKRSEVSVEEHDLHQELSMCTMDSILESAFGVPSDLQNNPNTEALEAVKSLVQSIQSRIFKPWLSLPIIREIFGRANEERRDLRTANIFFRNICSQRNQLTGIIDLDNEKTKPFVDALLGLRSDENIFDHMLTTFAAGNDTTATGMNYVLHLLALHPDHQAKVHEELDEVFKNSPDKDITFSDLAKIKYLEICIKESLRLLPPVPLMARSIGSDLQLEKDVVVPKNTEVAISIYHIHRDPLVYPDPEKFDPERFLPANCANRSLYAFIPFSMGPRNCIGQKYAMLQMKVLLTCLFRTFSISTTLKREDLKPIPGAVLEPNVKLLLTLTKRIV